MIAVHENVVKLVNFAKVIRVMVTYPSDMTMALRMLLMAVAITTAATAMQVYHNLTNTPI